MTAKSDNSDRPLDDKQRAVITAVIDRERVREWLIQRIAEHALEIVRQEKQANVHAEISLEVPSALYPVEAA